MTNLNKNTYQFSTDWFSYAIHNFENFLSKHKDQPVNFLEIGSFEGRSATWMLENILTHPESKLTCVDPGFNNSLSILKSNLSSFNNVRIIEKSSHQAWPEYIFDKFDFVYVDGNHSSQFCFFDGMIGLALLKSGGIMAFDDYEWKALASDGTSPKTGIDYFLDNFNNYKVLYKAYQVWIQKN